MSGPDSSDSSTGKSPAFPEDTTRAEPHLSEASASTLIGEQPDNSTVPGCGQTSATAGHDGDEEEEERIELEERAAKPWYKRPSSNWIIASALVSTIIASTSFAPRIDVYTMLACEALQIERTEGQPMPTFADWTWRKLPPPPKSCSQDPKVQEAVAALSTLIAIAQGLLTCLTAGWWGQLSDRYGRVNILKVTIVAFLITDFNFLLVSLAADLLPGGYRFLVFGAILSGAMGGFSTAMTTMTAYMSDTTAPELRSRNFSMVMGLIMCGMALGPAIGSYIIRATQDLLSVFYLGTANHLLFIVFLIFILPESVTKASMRKSRKRYAALREEQAAKLAGPNGVRTLRASIRLCLRSFLIPLEPLAVLLPHKRPNSKGRDWNMFWLAVTSVLNATLMGIYTFKFQYMQRAFGWDSETTGVWLTVVSASRAIFLVLLLPAAIHFFKPSAPPIELPISEEEPLDAASEPFPIPPQPSRSPSKSRAARKLVKFDFFLALFSLLVELVSYGAMLLSTSPVQWTVATVIGAFASGYGPAMKSVALALYERGPYEGAETGKLFGALGVIDAAAAHVISPALFGFIYIVTVERFPKGIFIVGAGLAFLATLSLLFIRISNERARPVAAHDQEATAVEPLIDDQ
ncbi:hypothetical protein M422DRAFT_780429 [Sphaerobolus stellatus SS14]|uniref:Major facilitator superfamily (MFS) profile domain-containing protein n=1 Tax=Sphaerobolus stellatus (strain SS14) TaxID=990650 RepID=A0A0C9V2Q5_SPHS4|nr:hypothetical protein M422DRAFT_780429 [Sphaerobolus stellatus SS14]